jgi:A-macroglobulin TED domain
VQRKFRRTVESAHGNGQSPLSQVNEGDFKLFFCSDIFRRVLFTAVSSYLERAVSRLTDPYEIAIVTYALTLTNSPAKEAAFNGLHQTKRESGKFEFFFFFQTSET